MITIAIAPCPFCAEPDVQIDEVDIGCFAVVCPECRCVGPVTGDVDESIDAWNLANR